MKPERRSSFHVETTDVSQLEPFKPRRISLGNDGEGVLPLAYRCDALVRAVAYNMLSLLGALFRAIAYNLLPLLVPSSSVVLHLLGLAAAMAKRQQKFVFVEYTHYNRG